MLRKPSLTTALLASTALTGLLVVSSLPAAAQSLPSGSTVASGSVSIGTPSSGGLTITQSSSNAIVNWQGFSIGEGHSVDIVQPGSSSAILNRVTGGTPSTIAGQINANGQVYLVNPNGIAISKSGRVRAGGGFVASTLEITDEDFNAGKRAFTGSGASAAVSNAGEIAVGPGGYAALIGGEVSNSGSISVPLGKVGLGSGEEAVLDLSGDGFLQVAVPTRGSGKGPLVENSGVIRADGGTVVLKAAAAREMARQAVNMSGTIEARSVSGRNGDIVLGGGGGVTEISGRIDAGGTGAAETGGRITVVSRSIVLKAAQIVASGRNGGGSIRIGGERQGGATLSPAETVSIDAASRIEADATERGDGGDVVVWSDVSTVFAGAISATGGAVSGKGGEAEVSGKVRLAYTGVTDLSAENGAFGSLLLDPYNVTISNGTDSNHSGFDATGDDSVINAGTLQTALGLANVTVSTGAGGSQAGNITVAAPLSWSAGSTLTLDAANTITVNAAITFGGTAGAGLTLNAANALAINAPITVQGMGDVTLAYDPSDPTKLSFASGTGLTYVAANGSALSSNAGGTLTINADPYTLLYTMADLDGIDGVAARPGDTVNTQANGLSGDYALARNLKHTGFYHTDALVGTGGATFSGTLTGLGNTITDLYIRDYNGTDYIGLVAKSSGMVRDIGLINADVFGAGDYVGSLVGDNSGTVTQSYVNATVIGFNSYVGGLVGSNSGTITQSYAIGSVSNNIYNLIGGLVGSNSGTIAQSYATAHVSSSGQVVGGLVGYNDGTVTQSFATGGVSASGSDVGGLVGYNNGSISQAYWDTNTSGTGGGSTTGMTGLTTAQFQSGSASNLGSSFAGGTGGLYPYLVSRFPNGVQAVSGIAYRDAGLTAATGSAAQFGSPMIVVLNANGRRIGQTSTGANGYYYMAVPDGTLANGDSLLASFRYDSLGSATLATSTGAATHVGLDLYGNAITAATSASLLSHAPGLADLRSAAAAVAGTDLQASNAISYATGTGYLATGASFSIDQATSVAAGSSFLVRTLAGSPITVDAAVTVMDTGSLGLLSGGALQVNAPLTAQGAAGINLSYDQSDPTNLAFAGGAGLTYAAANGSALSASAGGTLTINANPYTLLYTMADLDGIDGTAASGNAINAQAGLSGRYALARDMDATGTTYTDALIGDGGNAFTGTLTGLGHTVTGLTIDAPGRHYIGLVARSPGTIRDISLLGGSISGDSFVGGLAGYNSGLIAQSNATGTVSGTYAVGGLVGYSFNGSAIKRSTAGGSVSGVRDVGGLVGASTATIAQSSASANVSGSNYYIGGLVGTNVGAITQSYATGSISGSDDVGGLVGENSGAITQSYATGSVSASGSSGGGLVGYNIDHGTITQSYATGRVTGSGPSVGGLIGTNDDDDGTISQVFWNRQTSGQTNGIGIDDYGQSGNTTGLTTAQLQSGSASGLGAAFAGGTGGLYPYLVSLSPNGVQAVSGIAYKDAGLTVAASGAAGVVTVSLDANGGRIGQASTGANGYYYIALPSGTLTSGTSVLATVPATGALSANAAALSTSTGAATQTGLDLYGNAITATTASLRLSDASSLSTLRADATAAAGTDSAAAAVVAATTGTGYLATGASFSIDQATNVAAGSSLLVRTLAGSPLTVDAAITVASTGSLGLLSGGALRVNAPLTARGAAGINLAYDASDPTNLAFASGTGLTYAAANGSALTAGAGGLLTMNADSYSLLYTMADLDGIDGEAASGNAINAQADGLSGRYALARDIDATGTTYTKALVGTEGGMFSSTLTGLGHTVTGLTIDGSNNGSIGLVLRSDGTLRDIGLLGASISGDYYLGGLVGDNYGTVARATSIGFVSGAGAQTVGGLVGRNTGTITQSSAGGSVSGYMYLGGLVGTNSGTITQSTSSVSVSVSGSGSVAGYYVGGLVGSSTGTISQSTASGSVSSLGSNVGGLVGSSNGTISHSTASGVVTGADQVGGLVGYQVGSITQSAATGNVSSSGSYVGGLAGSSHGTISQSDASGRVSAAGNIIGGLVGFSAGAISQSTATGAVSGGDDAGGLVGRSVALITQSAATGNVLSSATNAGGLVGSNYSTISRSYATGAVSGADTVGGLAGSTVGAISESYATGSVSGTGPSVGGLVGASGSGGMSQVYWNTQTSGLTNGIGTDSNNQSGNTTGLTTAQFQSGSASGLGAAFAGGTGGLYPYLVSLSPNGVQAVSGIAYKDDGATVAASGAAGTVTVSLASGGTVIGQTTTGANGYYYIALPNGALASGAGVVVSTVSNGILSSAAASFSRSSGNAVAVSDLDISGGWRREATGGLTTLSALDTAYATAVGATPASTLTLADREIAAPGAFDLDGAVTLTGTLSLATPGAVTQSAGTVTAGGLLVTGGGSFLLTAAGNAVGTVAGSGTSLQLATSGNLATGTLVRAGGASVSGVATTGAVSLSATGMLTLASGAGVSGTSPVLSAGGAFINQAGSSALTATSGRWLVYSADPAGDTFGNLDSASTAVWNTAAGAAVAQGGNRYVFASQPMLTVTSTDRTKTYGVDATASVASAYMITGFDTGVVDAYLGDTAATALTGTASVTSAGSAATAGVAGSPYTMTAAVGTLATTSGYGLLFANTGHLTVAARALTVTADAQSRAYGDANPTLSYTLGGAGLVGGDALTGALATAATTTSNVGSYAIGQGTLAASANYALTYAGANLTVAARALTVTADAQSRAYGDANPTLSYTLGGAGLIGGDALTGALATAATTTSNIGSYAIGQGTLAASANYALTYAGANLTVAARALTVTADAQSRAYGDANPTLSYTLGGAGLIGGDALTGALATAATTTSNVGSYAIGQGTLAASANYALTYAGANLTVAARALTVTADAQSRAYGEANPTLSYTLGGAGLIGGDALTGALATAATTTSNVGSYAIGQGTLAASANYALTYAGANLTVAARALTVTADAQSRAYGEANPTLSYTLGGAGLIGGDALTGALATAATMTSNVGSYAIGQGTLAASANYALTYAGANLTVAARALTVTAFPPGASAWLAGTVTRNESLNREFVTWPPERTLEGSRDAEPDEGRGFSLRVSDARVADIVVCTSGGHCFLLTTTKRTSAP